MKENESLIKDENEAIEAIKSNMPTSGYYMLRQSLEMAIKALKWMRKYRESNRWVPVEEGLPKIQYDTVLCVTDKKHYFVGVFTTEFGFRTGDIDAEGTVVAWRPLPELYRPERSNNV